MDVGGDAEPALDRAIWVANGQSGHIEPAELAVGFAADACDSRVLRAGLQGFDPSLGNDPPVLGMDRGEPVALVAWFRLGKTDKVEQTLVGKGDLPLGIAGEDELRVELGEDAVAILAGAEGLVGEAVGGDIAEEDGDAIGRGKDLDAKPEVEWRRVERFEVAGDAFVHGPLIVLLVRRAFIDGSGELLPEVLTRQNR